MKSSQIIGFNQGAFIGLQIGSTVISIALTVLMIYLCVLGIKALKIYIKKNS